ncbi:Uncharacterized protein APZ42_005861, partial [Daphnia magna]
ILLFTFGGEGIVCKFGGSDSLKEASTKSPNTLATRFLVPIRTGGILSRTFTLLAVNWIWKIWSELTNPNHFNNLQLQIKSFCKKSENFKSNQMKKESNPNQFEIDLIFVKSKSKSNPNQILFKIMKPIKKKTCLFWVLHSTCQLSLYITY